MKLSNQNKLNIFAVAKDIFQVSLGLYLIGLIVETIEKGFVSNYFNLNILLIVISLSGVTLLLTYTKENSQTLFSERVWRYFFKNISTNTKIGWHQTLRDYKIRKLISEDWKTLYQDIHQYPKGSVYWSFLERDWRMFFRDLKKTNIKEKDWQLILVLSLIGGFLIFYKLRDLGTIAIITALITVLLIMTISYFVYSETD